MINADQKNPKKPQKYNCIICMLNTCNKKDYERHLSTVKQKKRENMIKSEHLPINTDNFTPNTQVVFICECGKHYKHSRSLWHHQKTCNYQKKKLEENALLKLAFSHLIQDILYY